MIYLLCSIKYSPFCLITKDHHSFNKIYNNNDFYVITIRHPYNSIISSILRYKQEINQTNLKNAINEYLHNGGYDIISNDFQKSNIIIVFYKDILFVFYH